MVGKFCNNILIQKGIYHYWNQILITEFMVFIISLFSKRDCCFCLFNPCSIITHETPASFGVESDELMKLYSQKKRVRTIIFALDSVAASAISTGKFTFSQMCLNAKAIIKNSSNPTLNIPLEKHKKCSIGAGFGNGKLGKK